MRYTLKTSWILLMTWTPAVLKLQYEATAHCIMHCKGCHMYLLKIHIHWAHNQRAIQGDGEASYRCISLEARNTPLWYKQISYGNLVGDGIVSYGPQRMQEQKFVFWINSNFSALHYIVLTECPSSSEWDKWASAEAEHLASEAMSWD